jgi:hypothetical protein
VNLPAEPALGELADGRLAQLEVDRGAEPSLPVDVGFVGGGVDPAVERPAALRVDRVSPANDVAGLPVPDSLFDGQLALLRLRVPVPALSRSCNRDRSREKALVRG